MKIAIYGVQSFLGANIANYLMQHSKADVFGIVTELSGAGLPHLEPSTKSRTRFSFQVSLDPYDIDKSCASRLRLEQPDKILVVSTDSGHPCTTVNPLFLGAQEMGVVLINLNEGTKMVLPGIHVNAGQVFGPRESSKRWFAKMCDDVIDGKELPLHNHGIHSMVYIKDYYDAVDKAITTGQGSDVEGHKVKHCDLSAELMAIAKGGERRLHNVRAEHLKFDLSEALEHTLAWRSVNKWVRAI